MGIWFTFPVYCGLINTFCLVLLNYRYNPDKSVSGWRFDVWGWDTSQQPVSDEGGLCRKSLYSCLSICNIFLIYKTSVVVQIYEPFFAHQNVPSHMELNYRVTLSAKFTPHSPYLRLNKNVGILAVKVLGFWTPSAPWGGGGGAHSLTHSLTGLLQDEYSWSRPNSPGVDQTHTREFETKWDTCKFET